jgi:hypothetical protein
MDARFAEVMSIMRGSKVNASFVQPAAEALADLAKRLSERHLPNKAAVLAAMREAETAYREANADLAIQHLSRAVFMASRAEQGTGKRAP